MSHQVEFRCARCDDLLQSELAESGRTSSGPCPACGSTDVVCKATLTELIAAAEDSMSVVGRDGETNKVVLKGHVRSSETLKGPLAGSRARVEQVVDNTVTPGRYRKKVTLADGTVAKDVEGPLTDQSLHGPRN